MVSAVSLNRYLVCRRKFSLLITRRIKQHHRSRPPFSMNTFLISPITYYPPPDSRSICLFQPYKTPNIPYVATHCQMDITLNGRRQKSKDPRPKALNRAFSYTYRETRRGLEIPERKVHDAVPRRRSD